MMRLPIVFSFIIALLFPFLAQAHSISGEPSGFSASNLISDSNFLNKDSMDGNAINNFLASKGSWLANYTIPEHMEVPYFCRNDDGNPVTRTTTARQRHVN